MLSGFFQRKTSETGRKNFRSKRFSRNMERNGGGGEAQKQRAHSAHSRIEEDPDGEWRSRSASGEGRGARSKTRQVGNPMGLELVPLRFPPIFNAMSPIILIRSTTRSRAQVRTPPTRMTTTALRDPAALAATSPGGSLAATRTKRTTRGTAATSATAAASGRTPR